MNRSTADQERIPEREAGRRYDRLQTDVHLPVGQAEQNSLHPDKRQVAFRAAHPRQLDAGRQNEHGQTDRANFVPNNYR